METEYRSLGIVHAAFKRFRRKTGDHTIAGFVRDIEKITGVDYSANYLTQIISGYFRPTQKLCKVALEYLTFPNQIGGRIRWLRWQKEYTLKELSERSGLSISYLCDIERGRKEPPLRTLRKIAQGLECDLQTLLDGIE